MAKKSFSFIPSWMKQHMRLLQPSTGSILNSGWYSVCVTSVSCPIVQKPGPATSTPDIMDVQTAPECLVSTALYLHD